MTVYLQLNLNLLPNYLPEGGRQLPGTAATVITQAQLNLHISFLLVTSEKLSLPPPLPEGLC